MQIIFDYIDKTQGIEIKDNIVSLKTPFPTLGFIPLDLYFGWKYIPIRIFWWFHYRYRISKLGPYCLAVVFNEKTKGSLKELKPYIDLSLEKRSKYKQDKIFEIGDLERIKHKVNILETSY